MVWLLNAAKVDNFVHRCHGRYRVCFFLFRIVSRVVAIVLVALEPLLLELFRQILKEFIRWQASDIRFAFKVDLVERSLSLGALRRGKERQRNEIVLLSRYATGLSLEQLLKLEVLELSRGNRLCHHILHHADQLVCALAQLFDRWWLLLLVCSARVSVWSIVKLTLGLTVILLLILLC